MRLYQSPDNPHAHLTAIDRREVSYPTRWLRDTQRLQGRILDFGCGKMKDLTSLQAEGFDVTGFDPYYRNAWPTGTFDTIICHYVLNVLMALEQTFVLMCVSELLKPGGTAYFTVRRDLEREGFRDHYIHRVATYQCQVQLPFPSLHRARHCEIYAYQHYPLAAPEAVAAFAPAGKAELITETATVYAIYAPDPVRPGHALIIPKRRTEHYFDLSLREQTACTIVTNRTREHLDQRYQPQGYNLITNTGPAAGQVVPQTHIHLIPRT